MKEITNSDISLAKGHNVLLFCGEHCKSCPKVVHGIEMFAKTKPTGIKFFKLDRAKNGEIAVSLDIMSLPTVVIFDGAKEVHRYVGSTADTYTKKFFEGKV